MPERPASALKPALCLCTCFERLNDEMQRFAVQGLLIDSSSYDDAVASIQNNMDFLELNAADACAWLARH